LLELIHYDPITGIIRWRVGRSGRNVGDIGGCTELDGYRSIQLDCRKYQAHRVAWFYVNGRWPVGKLDHRNNQRADNPIDNLREASNGDNAANARLRKDNTSGFKGVSRDPRSPRWIALIRKNRKQIYLGSFDTREEAYAVYCAAAVKHFGEFARIA
jgi:hypothetical protein